MTNDTQQPLGFVESVEARYLQLLMVHHDAPTAVLVRQAITEILAEARPVGEIVVESMGVPGSDAMRASISFYKAIPLPGTPLFTHPAPPEPAEARERIAELQRQLDRLRSHQHSCHANCDRAGCVNTRLRAELDNERAKVDEMRKGILSLGDCASALTANDVYLACMGIAAEKLARPVPGADDEKEGK